MKKLVWFIIALVIIVLLAIIAYLVYSSKPIVCNDDSGCGIQGSYSDSYCDGNIVKKDLINYKCLSPGTRKSSCVIDKTPETVKECVNLYKCSTGECLEKNCNEITEAVWLGGPTSSRIFFDTPQKRNQLNLIVMRTGADFKVHIFTDKSGLPDRKLFSSLKLNDSSIDDNGWVKLSMQGVETMPSGYYWVGIEVIKYGNSAYNTCVFNDRNDDTYSREDTITNGAYKDFNDNLKTQSDIIYMFE